MNKKLIIELLEKELWSERCDHSETKKDCHYAQKGCGEKSNIIIALEKSRANAEDDFFILGDACMKELDELKDGIDDMADDCTAMEEKAQKDEKNLDNYADEILSLQNENHKLEKTSNMLQRQIIQLRKELRSIELVEGEVINNE